jgi:hypothetical protein
VAGCGVGVMIDREALPREIAVVARAGAVITLRRNIRTATSLISFADEPI